MLAGCGAELTGPEPDGVTEPPSYVALLLPAVQMAREAARPAASEDGTVYDFQIEERLFADGQAVGFAMLGVAQSGDRYLYRFQEGRSACEEGAPAVYLVALAQALPNPATGAGDPPSRSGRGIWYSTHVALTGTTTAGSWMVHILPQLDQAAVHEPIRFVAELDVRFQADPCGIVAPPEESERHPEQPLTADHLTIIDGPIGVRMDDLLGSAMIQLVGQMGGTAHGHMSMAIGGSHTTYVVRTGNLEREGDGYRWTLEGLAVVRGQGLARRPFRAELALSSGETLQDGDIWIIDGTTYIRDQGDWLCL